MISVRLTREPLDPKRAALVRTDAYGAHLVFEGIVRDHHEGRAVTHIDYEAYEAMALSELEALSQEVAARHGITHLVLDHRLGRVPVGEPSLFVAIGSAHRGPAIQALAELIDELKRRVPIWKHEFGPDGAAYVGGVLPEVPPL